MPRAHLLPTIFLFTACPAHVVHDDPLAAGTTHDDPGPDPPTPTSPTPTTPTTSFDPTTGESPTTGDASTTDTWGTTAPDTTTTTPGDDTTGAPASCGNSEVDPGEQCDEGHGNNSDSTSLCTLHCQLNVCGDGLVHVGVEACDDGVDNSDFLYDGCSTTCTRTKFCGDGEVNGPEECDRGELNGTDDKDADAVPCSASCTHASLLVFLSSVTYGVHELGGGAYQADGRCRDLAAAAMLPNHQNFKAWISDKFSYPAYRFNPTPDLPYALKSGLRIADDYAQLTTSGPLTGITLTETGVTIYDARVWTDTKTDGNVFDDTLACDNWTSNSFAKKASVGRSGVDKANLAEWNKWKSGQWTTHVNLGCDNEYHIYCFEQ